MMMFFTYCYNKVHASVCWSRWRKLRFAGGETHAWQKMFGHPFPDHDIVRGIACLRATLKANAYAFCSMLQECISIYIISKILCLFNLYYSR